MSPGKNIRIKDIARLAGVSAGTVDRVLHNRGRVSEEALRKIMAVMEQIDYKPNLIARTLGSNRKYRVAILFPDPDSDPYWKQAAQGIAGAVEEWTQYGVTISQFPFDKLDRDSFKETARRALTSEPDGLVAAPILYNEALPVFDQFREKAIPYVLFNTNVEEVHPLTFIGQNLYESGRVGAELMRIGQPPGGKFAILHIDEDVMNSVHLREKERGFRDYFSERGSPAFEIVAFNLNPKDPSFSSQLLGLYGDPALCGVFISTSRGTAVAASLLAETGKRRIRCIGYDLLEDNLALLRGGAIDFLINQNPKRQVNLGISHMINHLMFKRTPPTQELFPLEIITPENVNSYLGSGIH